MQPQQALSINLTSTKEGKRLLCLLSASLASLLLFILSFSCRPPSSLSSRPRLQSNPPIPFRGRSSASVSTTPPPPSLAYFISGSNDDGDRVLRLLHAVYHPKNRYLLHLDRAASQDQRERLAIAVQSIPVFKAARNVDVMGKPDAFPASPEYSGDFCNFIFTSVFPLQSLCSSRFSVLLFRLVPVSLPFALQYCRSVVRSVLLCFPFVSPVSISAFLHFRRRNTLAQNQFLRAIST